LSNFHAERRNAIAGAAFTRTWTLVRHTFYHLHVFAMVDSLRPLCNCLFGSSPR
jgi:hypothetical protein